MRAVPPFSSSILPVVAVASLACLAACGPAPGSSAPPRPSVPPPGGTAAPTVAAGPSSAGPATAGSPGCGNPVSVGVAAMQGVVLAGRVRQYTVVVPAGYAPYTPYPLVVVLHGGGGSGAAVRAQTDLERVAGGRAIFVYPDAINGNWDLDSKAEVNPDVALFDSILFTAHNTLCTDARRVFVTGFSNGAYMANQLGCRRGERIRGIVSHAGGGPYEMNGSYDAQGRLVCPGKAVAALVVHGQVDGVVLPAEGQKSLDHWSQANRCSSSIAGAWIPPCTAQQGCFQPVGSCRIPGLGHGTWKEAGKVTWAFFEGLR